MTTDDDDFWGNQAEWPEVPEQERRASRPTTGARMSGWWNRIVGGGVEGTRHHGGHGVAQSPDAFDADDFDVIRDEPIGDPDPVRRAASEPTDPTAGARPTGPTDEEWDDDWVVESDPTPTPGVDPLLARLGGLAIVTTLLVPLALGLRSHGDTPAATDVTSAAVTVVATPVDPSVPPAVTTPTVAPAAAASTPAQPAASGPSPVPVTAAPAPASTGEVSSSPPSTAAEQGDATLTTAALADEAIAPEQSSAIDYDVVEGDFWIRLADGAGIPLDELLDANDSTVDTPLYPGTTICLPDGATVPAPPTTAAPATTTPAATASKPAATTKPVTTSKPATTAAPTTTAKPAVTYPAISAAVATQVIRDVWPDELEDRAIEIATRESSLAVTAKNSCCYGLFQLNWSSHKSWLTGLGVGAPEQLFDATTNAYTAYVLYQRSGGWGPWT